MPALFRITTGLCLCCLLPAIAFAQTANAIKQKNDRNPTAEKSSNIVFEDSFEKGRQVPDGWRSGATIAGVKYVYEKKSGSTGKRSLSLQKSAQRYFPIAQWFRIIPAPKTNSINVSAMVKANRCSKAILEVQFLGGSGKFLSKKWVGYIGAKSANDPPVTHAWKEYGDSADIPAGATQVLIGLQIYGPGKVWFDDVKVSTGKSSASGTSAPLASKGSKAADAKEITINGAGAQYILGAPRKPSKKPQGLLIVLPGGDGSAEFAPFVKRIHSNAAEDIVLAQPIAKKWTDSQQIVWPTADLRVDSMKYTTEEFIEAVVNDVRKSHTLDSQRIYVLAWSSSGMAAYSAMLVDKPVVSGAFIAMSVFKPDYLPDLKVAKERRFYLLHSPDDRTCPYWMAEKAKKDLTNRNAQITLANYSGGHGWRGDLYGNIRRGLEWLEKGKSDR